MPLCGAFLGMAFFGVSKSDSTVEGSASSAGGAGSVSKEDHFDALDAFDQLVFDQGAICVDAPESTSSERHVQQSSVCPLADITSEQSAGIPLTDKVGEQHSGEDDKPVQTVPIPRFKRLPNGEICGSRVARQASAKGKCKGKAKTKAKVSPSKFFQICGQASSIQAVAQLKWSGGSNPNNRGQGHNHRPVRAGHVMSLVALLMFICK